MKSSISALNPYAESYVPISRRDPNNESHEVAVSDEPVPRKLSDTDHPKQKCGKVDNPQGNSYSLSEVIFTDEQCEMEVAYLQMTYPGVSVQSLVDVYTVNGRDLDASLEMMFQLESVETPVEQLPEALGIGDLLEPAGTSGECSTTKPMNAASATY